MDSIRPTSWLLVMALAASPALGPRAGIAGSADQVPLGARAMAMGGAFSSIADDATASFWNPAGLPWIGHQEITGAHASLFGSGINDNFAAFVLPQRAEWDGRDERGAPVRDGIYFLRARSGGAEHTLRLVVAR